MTLASNFPDQARDLLMVTGKNLMNTLGLPELRRIVSQLLNGVNLRLATEPLTQKRLHLLNVALIQTYSRIIESGITLDEFVQIAYKELQNPKTNRVDKIILRWMLGLTGKLADNVLRAEEAAADQYLKDMQETLGFAATHGDKNFGSVLSTSNAKPIDWNWGLSLLMAIGAQTLATRGSEKSLYGKFFEKMALGSVLSILDFKLAVTTSLKPGNFTLSTTSKRESDATILWHSDMGVRFDIGFIGRGNSEITLDKVTRFEREIELNGRKTNLKTFIIVDRVGKTSKTEELAEKVDGVIIQMSRPMWVKELGSHLESVLPKYKSPVRELEGSKYSNFLEIGVNRAPLEEIFNLSVPESENGNAEIDEGE